MQRRNTSLNVTHRSGSVRTRYSLRLPLAVAARLAAWCEMQPQRARGEIVAELLAAGLAQAETDLARAGVPVVERLPDTRQPLYLPTGPFAEFRGLVSKHHLLLEHEFDHDAPGAPYPAVDYLLSEE